MEGEIHCQKHLLVMIYVMWSWFVYTYWMVCLLTTQSGFTLCLAVMQGANCTSLEVILHCGTGGHSIYTAKDMWSIPDPPQQVVWVMSSQWVQKGSDAKIAKLTWYCISSLNQHCMYVQCLQSSFSPSVAGCGCGCGWICSSQSEILLYSSESRHDLWLPHSCLCHVKDLLCIRQETPCMIQLDQICIPSLATIRGIYSLHCCQTHKEITWPDCC